MHLGKDNAANTTPRPHNLGAPLQTDSLDKLSVPVFVVCPRSAGFLYVNDAACRSLGLPRHALLASKLPDIAPNCARPGVLEKLFGRLHSAGSLRIPATHRHADGHCFAVEVFAHYRTDAKSPYIIAVAIPRDAASRPEEFADKNSHDTERRCNFAGIDALGAQVAHEINSPLAAATGFAQMIGRKTTNPIVRHYVEQILRALDRVHDVVNQLRAVSETLPGTNKPLSFDASRTNALTRFIHGGPGSSRC